MDLLEISNALSKSSLRGYTLECLYPKILKLIESSRKIPEFNNLEGAKRFCISKLDISPGMTDGVVDFINALFKKMIDTEVLIYSPKSYKIKKINKDKMKILFAFIFTFKKQIEQNELDSKEIIKNYFVSYNGKDFKTNLYIEYYDEDNPVHLRIYKPIRLNEDTYPDKALSIQASKCHYCYPQRTVDNLNEYKSMEIAFLSNGSLMDYGLVYSEILKNLPKDLVDSITLCNDGTVFANVPVEDIQKLVELIC